jgi:hypothetical protein
VVQEKCQHGVLIISRGAHPGMTQGDVIMEMFMVSSGDIQGTKEMSAWGDHRL